MAIGGGISLRLNGSTTSSAVMISGVKINGDGVWIFTRWRSYVQRQHGVWIPDNTQRSGLAETLIGSVSVMEARKVTEFHGCDGCR